MATHDVQGVLLAAGKSSRMRGFNKLTALIGGRPLIWYSLENLRNAGIGSIFVVVGHESDRVQVAIGDHVKWITQEKQEGTGHAAAQVIPHLDSESTVVVLFGDCPFLDGEIIRRTLDTHHHEAADLTIATVMLRDPRALGQVRRRKDHSLECILDGRIEQNVNSGYAEVFAGLSVWNAEAFCQTLPNLEAKLLPGGHKEQNLPDAVELLEKKGKKVASYSEIRESDAIAPNDPIEFEAASAYLRAKVRALLIAQGVEIQDQHTVNVDYDVRVATNTMLHRNVNLLGNTIIGHGCEIGPDTTLHDCIVGNLCKIGRGSWKKQRFLDGARASDRLTDDVLKLFKKPYYLIPEEPKHCFAILPFHTPYSDLLENVLRPVLEERGFECITANRFTPGVIADDIWEGINRARLIVAEVSEDNPNVWYELGLAHALNKEVIVICKKERSGPFPFDVGHQRRLIYDPNTGDLHRLFREWIAAFVDAGG